MNQRRAIATLAGFYLTPTLLVLLAVLVLPSLAAIFYSFFNYEMFTGATSPVGLRNYQTILSDPVFYESLVNTLIYTVGAVGIEFMLGLAIALLLNMDVPGVRLVRAIVISPWTLSAVVVGLVWRMMFHANFGIVNYSLSLFGIPMGSINWLSDPNLAKASVVVGDVWQNTPFVALLLLSGLQMLPQEPYEAARVDGANPWQTLTMITLPMLKPAILAVVVFRLIFALREFTIPWTMTSGGPGTSTQVLSMYLYRRVFVSFDFGGGAAVGVILLALTVVLSYLLVRRMVEVAQ